MGRWYNSSIAPSPIRKKKKKKKQAKGQWQGWIISSGTVDVA